MRHIALLIACFVASVIAGCAIFGGKVDPNADPFVVSAEQSVQSSHSVCKAFLQLDDDNRDFVKTELPAVHSFAESLRAKDATTGEPMEISVTRQAFEAIETYKAVKTPATQSDVNAKLQAVENLAMQAQQYIAAITAKKVKPSVLESPMRSPALMWA